MGKKNQVPSGPEAKIGDRVLLVSPEVTGLIHHKNGIGQLYWLPDNPSLHPRYIHQVDVKEVVGQDREHSYQGHGDGPTEIERQSVYTAHLQRTKEMDPSGGTYYEKKE